MTLFKPRKNRTFNYQSKFSEENELDTDLDVSKKRDFITKWRSDRKSSRKAKGVMSLKMLILVLVLLLICMYLLDSKFK